MYQLPYNAVSLCIRAFEEHFHTWRGRLTARLGSCLICPIVTKSAKAALLYSFCPLLLSAFLLPLIVSMLLPQSMVEVCLYMAAYGSARIAYYFRCNGEKPKTDRASRDGSLMQTKNWTKICGNFMIFNVLHWALQCAPWDGSMYPAHVNFHGFS